ncbi:conserved hypothetical protein [Candidatus Propionivibrio aalborgensis]|uniref:Uncharacterized protein n=2 Tax=Candidatus Propionivibrio aalborgensis TaxID=1860101 RepID=A0A1A8XYK0_9RHOO|nr:conserved hypothetical protein [Candidatus Propionivibrio aalborgensis]
MYPVPRMSKIVIDEWSEELAARFNCTAVTLREQSSRLLSFPPETIRVELMDDSQVEFKYAFFIVSETRKAIAVFTEHCGHHVFPYHEARVFREGLLSYEQQGA